MSNTYIKGEVVFECDTCGETFGYDGPDFARVWSAAKREGWTARKVGQDWVHKCNECNVEEENERA